MYYGKCLPHIKQTFLRGRQADWFRQRLVYRSHHSYRARPLLRLITTSISDKRREWKRETRYTVQAVRAVQAVLTVHTVSTEHAVTVRTAGGGA